MCEVNEKRRAEICLAGDRERRYLSTKLCDFRYMRYMSDKAREVLQEFAQLEE